MAACIPLCKMLIEKDNEKGRKRAAKAAGLSFVLDRAGFQKFLKISDNTSLENKMAKLTKENNANAIMIHRLQEMLKETDVLTGAVSFRTLTAMAQELMDSETYIETLKTENKKLRELNRAGL